jgi:hypothetical protein
MSRLTNLVLGLSVSSIALTGLLAAPANAATTTVHRSLLVGELGIEGGAFPGGFRPTAGSVEVEFNSVPLVLEKRVGKSGKFEIKLTPGDYTVIGCGTTASGAPSSQCSKPQKVNLAPGEVDHIQLVWLYAP